MLITDRDMIVSAATRLLLLSSAFCRVEPTARKGAIGDWPMRVAQLASSDALGVINNLCLVIRSHQDRINDRNDDFACGSIFQSTDAEKCNEYFISKKTPISSVEKLNLRESLNKFAHIGNSEASYSIEDDHHYIFIKGSWKNKYFVAKISVEFLAISCLSFANENLL